MKVREKFFTGMIFKKFFHMKARRAIGGIEIIESCCRIQASPESLNITTEQRFPLPDKTPEPSHINLLATSSPETLSVGHCAAPKKQKFINF